jgi:hypothetical protein
MSAPLLIPSPQVAIPKKVINNIRVRPVQLGNGAKKQARGYDLFSEPYANIFICARKKSGKTVLINKILKECSSKKTHIIIVCPTVAKDRTYEKIIEYFENKGNVIDTFHDLKDSESGDVIADALASPTEEDKMEVEQPEVKKVIFTDDESGIEIVKKKRKPKADPYITPETIFVFDDLGSDLRSRAISQLMKTNRHYKCKVILSSQYVNDLEPQSIKQLDYFLSFRGHSQDKMALIHKHLDIAIPFDQFYELYKDATSSPFSFFYYANVDGEMRKNFNEKY